MSLRIICGAPVEPQPEPLKAACAAAPSLGPQDRVIQQSSTDMESVLHLTGVWEAITLAHTRQLYLIYRLPALSPFPDWHSRCLFIQSAGAGRSRRIGLYSEAWKTWQGAKFKPMPICATVQSAFWSSAAYFTCRNVQFQHGDVPFFFRIRHTLLHCIFFFPPLYVFPLHHPLSIKSSRCQKYVGYSSVDRPPQPMNNIDCIFATHRSHLTVHLAETSGIFILGFKQV